MDTSSDASRSPGTMTLGNNRSGSQKPLPSPPPLPRETENAKTPLPYYMDHGLIPVYDMEGTYPEAHNYSDGNWLIPGAPPPESGLEPWGGAPRSNSTLAVGVDDGLPERLKDDADLEVVTAPEPSQPFLSRNKKWTIVGIILFLVIAGAVGGAVGGVMAKKSGLGSQAPVDSPTVNQKTDGNSTASNLKTQLLATERVGSAVFLDWAPYDDANGGYGLRSIHTFYQTPDGWIRWKVFNEDKASLFGAAKFGNYTGWPSDEGIIINSIKARPRSSIGIAQAKYYGYKRPSGYIQDSRPPVEKILLFYFNEEDYVSNVEFRFSTGKWTQGVVHEQKKAGAPGSGLAAGWCPPHLDKSKMQIDSGMVFFQNKATGKIDVMVEGGIVKSNELETDILNQKFDKAYSVPTSGTRDSARKDNGWEYEAPLYGTDIGWTMNADFGVISSSFLGRVYYQMPNGKIQATIMNLTIWEEQQYNSADFGVETVFPKAVTGIEQVGDAIINTTIAVGLHDSQNWRLNGRQDLSPMSPALLELRSINNGVYKTNTTVMQYQNPEATVYVLSKPDTISTFTMDDIKNVSATGGRWNSKGAILGQADITSLAVEGENLFVTSGNIEKVKWYEEYGQWKDSRPEMPVP